MSSTSESVHRMNSTAVLDELWEPLGETCTAIAICTIVLLVSNLVLAGARAASFPDPGSQDDFRVCCQSHSSPLISSG